MTFDGIVFDLDGTLIDSIHDARANLNLVLEGMGRRPLTLDETKSGVGNGAWVLVEKTLELTGPPVPPTSRALHAGFPGPLRQNPVQLTPIFPGVLDVLAQLKAEGLRLGICTNKPESTTGAVLDGLGLAGYFQAVTCGDNVHHRKPDGRHVLLTMEMMGAGTAVMVGDSETDMAAGRNAGIPIVRRRLRLPPLSGRRAGCGHPDRELLRPSRCPFAHAGPVEDGPMSARSTTGPLMLAALAGIALLMTLKYFPGLENPSDYAGNVFQAIHPGAFPGDPNIDPERSILEKSLQLSLMYLFPRLMGEIWLDDRFVALVYWGLVLASVLGIDRIVRGAGIGRCLCAPRRPIDVLTRSPHPDEGHDIRPSAGRQSRGLHDPPHHLADLHRAGPQEPVGDSCPVRPVGRLFHKECALYHRLLPDHRRRLRRRAGPRPGGGRLRRRPWRRSPTRSSISCPSPKGTGFRSSIWCSGSSASTMPTPSHRSQTGSRRCSGTPDSCCFAGRRLSCLGRTMPPSGDSGFSSAWASSSWLLGGLYFTFAPDALKLPHVVPFSLVRNLRWPQTMAYVVIMVCLFHWLSANQDLKRALFAASAVGVMLVMGPANYLLWGGLFLLALGTVAGVYFVRDRESGGTALARRYPLALFQVLALTMAVSYTYSISKRLPAWRVLAEAGVMGDAGSATWIGVDDYFRDNTPGDAVVLPLFHDPRIPDELRAKRHLATRSGRTTPVYNQYSSIFDLGGWKRELEQNRLLERIARMVVSRELAEAGRLIDRLAPRPDYVVLPAHIVNTAKGDMSPFEEEIRIGNYVVLRSRGKQKLILSSLTEPRLC